MRASRLMSILLLLQARSVMTAEQLADELEVTPRTIYRDIEALQVAGVPVYGSSGHGGGYRLVAGFRTRLDGLTVDEAEAMCLAGLPTAAAELGLSSQVASVALKMRSAIPDPFQERADAFRERILFDPSGWYHDGDESTFLTDVATAVLQSRRIEVDYESWTQTSTRRLLPYGLVLKGGRWYLLATDSDNDPALRLRSYRISHIRRCLTFSENFVRWPEFNLATYWADHVAQFRNRPPNDQATVRISPEGRRRLRELANHSMLDAIEAQIVGPGQESAWVTATIPIESDTWAVSELLRLGPEVEVLGPPRLRLRITEAIRGLSEHYLSTED